MQAVVFLLANGNFSSVPGDYRDFADVFARFLRDFARAISDHKNAFNWNVSWNNHGAGLSNAIIP